MIEENQYAFPQQDIENITQDQRRSPVPSHRLRNSMPVFDFEETLSPRTENVSSAYNAAQPVAGAHDPLIKAKGNYQSSKLSSLALSNQRAAKTR
jgi:hypothetical protein